MRNIALYMGLSDFFEHGIARGVVRYARTRPDWRIFGFGWMFRRLEDISSWKGDGVIARIEDGRTADRLAALRIPVVDVAGGYDRPRFAKVTNDDYLTGYEAARHLIGCGLPRFAFLGVRGARWSDERRRGFERAIAERGEPSGGKGGGRAREAAARASIPSFDRPLEWWEGWEEGDREPAADRGAMETFLSGLRRPVGLFACNDTTGLRAAGLAGRLRIPVPESLAILGVDNEDILCELAAPGLSSIKLDCEAIGYRAAVALDEALEGPARRRAVVAVPPMEVAERASTRVYACDDELVARAATFIRSEAQEGIDVSDVLAVVPASRRTLEKRFKAALGVSLHDEIVRVRLARAKRLLRETGRTIEAVAEESGFGTAQRFHELFREREGLPPGEWRRTKGRSAP